MDQITKPIKTPSIFQALLPIIVLLGLIILNVVFVYGDSSLEGPNQIALIAAAGVAAFFALRMGYKWKHILIGMTNAINSAMSAILILLLIGALAGTWLISGVVPTMIYYGLETINPTIFLFAACFVSAIVSLATGSSWTTIATVGVALLGIGTALGFSPALVAGAVISGAYFGDKMSPLSDTTNLAPAMAGTDLFTHIKYMMWTTVPSIIITLIIFLIIGFFSSAEGNLAEIEEIKAALDAKFNISPFLFLVPVGVIVMIIVKVPPIPALLGGAVLGAIFGIAFQPQIINELNSSQLIEANFTEEGYTVIWEDETSESVWNASEGEGSVNVEILKGDEVVSTGSIQYPMLGDELTEQSFVISLAESEALTNQLDFKLVRSGYAENAYRTVVNAMTVDTVILTESETVNDLLGTSGMAGMLNTIFLIVCAMCFGGAMESCGMLKRLSQAILSGAKKRGGLIFATTATCLGFNLTASDQYLAIVIPGKMFASAYKERGLAPENLSRTLEDSATVTSVLIPWNTCGAAQSTVLHVYTGEYMFFCFFNIISPLMTIAYGYLGIKIAKLKSVGDDD
ncbi:MAG: NhaC family Na+:H+ antiporter [Parvicellaceae bacterium]|jgi:NhaC family Na+:H+ antiporter